MKNILLTDIGSTYTKVCLVDMEKAAVIAVSKSRTTIETDVRIGLENAKRPISKYLTGVKETFACSSAAGGLKIAAIGLIPELTSEAAKQAALGAGGKVIKTYSFSLTDTDILELKTIKPDLLLLTGGIDGGNTEYILNNAVLIRDNIDLPVIVAGNRSSYDDIKNIFKTKKDIYYAENVMPEFKKLNLEPARELIKKVFLEKIVKAKGIDIVGSEAKILMPTPVAVFKAGNILSKEYEELMIIDMGGATTDVYSFSDGKPSHVNTSLKGFPEPFDKRTVEADIGMRHTVNFLFEQVDFGAEKNDILSYVNKVKANTSYLPKNKEEEVIETRLAFEGVKLAVTRHAGKIEEVYTPEGKIFLQEGKDLRKIKTVIGSGGPIIFNKKPKDILKGVIKHNERFSLRPVKPAFLLDKMYILWALGLIAEISKEVALKLGKKYLRSLS